MDKKILSAFILLITLLLSSCPAPLKLPVQSPSWTLNVVVRDSETLVTLATSEVRVMETGTSLATGTGEFSLQLDEGIYTVYILNSGYLTKGYVINLEKDVSITASLNKDVNDTREYANLSGTVFNDTTPYTDYFSIYMSDGTVSDAIQDLIDENGAFTVNTVCGTISVSASTLSDSVLDRIDYVKGLTHTTGSPLSGLTLNLNDASVLYSGSMPVDGSFYVLLEEGNMLASQAPGSSGYSFLIDLIADDSITMESVKYSDSNTYFTKADAGQNGGTTNLSFDIEAPTFIVSGTTDYYTIEFSIVANASYYETYVVEEVSGVMRVPFYAICTAGTTIKIPKDVLTENPDNISFYCTAVRNSGFSLTALLGDTLSLDNYTYAESGKENTRTIGGPINYRKLTNTPGLFSEIMGGAR